MLVCIIFSVQLMVHGLWQHFHCVVAQTSSTILKTCPCVCVHTFYPLHTVPPASPTNISVKDIGPTFATLNWVRPSNPGHPELSEYAIWYQRADGMGPNETLSTTDSCINITGLAPGVSYRARVMASSQTFMGNFSEPFVFLTSFTRE